MASAGTRQAEGIDGLIDWATDGPRDELTFSDAGHSFLLITLGLLEREEHIDLRPVGEHLSNDGRLVAVQLAQLANVSLIFKCGRSIGRLLVELVPVRSPTASTSKTASATAARASTARGGGP